MFLWLAVCGLAWSMRKRIFIFIFSNFICIISLYSLGPWRPVRELHNDNIMRNCAHPAGFQKRILFLWKWTGKTRERYNSPTELLNGLKLAYHCKRMKTAFDTKWKTEKFDYMNTLSRKQKSHSRLTHGWAGLYQVLKASGNFALIGEDNEPLWIQFDHLVKVPAGISYSPILTTRRRVRPRKRQRSENAPYQLILSGTLLIPLLH